MPSSGGLKGAVMEWFLLWSFTWPAGPQFASLFSLPGPKKDPTPSAGGGGGRGGDHASGWYSNTLKSVFSIQDLPYRMCLNVETVTPCAFKQSVRQTVYFSFWSPCNSSTHFLRILLGLWSVHSRKVSVALQPIYYPNRSRSVSFLFPWRKIVFSYHISFHFLKLSCY